MRTPGSGDDDAAAASYLLEHRRWPLE